MNIKNVEFAKFKIDLISTEEGYLPKYCGSTLRGALGQALKQICCSEMEENCENCLIENRCVYRYVFETKAPLHLGKRFHNAPRPYVLEPYMNTTTSFKAGDQFSFNIILIGKTIEYLPYFLMSIKHMGKNGLGKSCLKFIINRVSAFNENNSLNEMVVYEPNTGLNEDFKRFTSTDIEKRAEQIRKDTIKLRFITPVRITQKGKHIRHISFQCLVEDLLRRFSLLSQLYWDTPQDWDISDLIQNSRNVEEIKTSLYWFDWERYSNRQNNKMKFGGLIGESAFSGELDNYLPLLALGEHLHAGGRTTFGLGKYEITHEADIS